MKVINSKNVIEFLSKSAPHAWVERLLFGMICSEELIPYFSSGKIIQSAHKRLEIMEMSYRRTSGDLDAVLSNLDEYFEQEIVEKIREGSLDDRLEVIGFSFLPDDDARQFPNSLFFYADEIDWKDGTLIANLDYDTVKHMGLIYDEELFGSYLINPDYEIELQGLAFDQSAIELLQPSIPIENEFTISVNPPSRLGRPRRWDWDAAAAYLISIAQTPDGLPTGLGAQAKIERLVADWFIRETSDAPSSSQIRQHVATLIRALKKPESP